MNKFLKEIEEQPEALINTFQYYQSAEGRAALNHIRDLWESGNYEELIFTGMGSSYFLSQAAATMLTAGNIPAFAVNAGEMLHSQFPILSEHTLLVCISQSGESYEIVKLLEKISSKVTVIGISNENNSTLVKKSVCSLICNAGKEEMTSTKTFITTYLIIYLLSQCLQKEDTNDTKGKEIAEEIKRLIVTQMTYIPQSLDFLGDSSFVQLIGRGTDFAAVAQSALMFMEAAKIPASALLGGEFRHGPLEMIHEDFIGIIFASTKSNTYNQTIALIRDVLSFGGKVIFVSDYASGLKNNNLLQINIHCDEADLFTIPSIIPIQLIVNALAEKKGLAPGDFIHGSKVTSIE